MTQEAEDEQLLPVSLLAFQYPSLKIDLRSICHAVSIRPIHLVNCLHFVAIFSKLFCKAFGIVRVVVVNVSEYEYAGVLERLKGLQEARRAAF